MIYVDVRCCFTTISTKGMQIEHINGAEETVPKTPATLPPVPRGVLGLQVDAEDIRVVFVNSGRREITRIL